ncbi:efflux transporter outer membrane subunit [bacterium]|nr:efflux transporter outer membrane subunit [bacterium]MCI0607355.1 efflux transporter outer membrane subunit [bacterium]
MNRRILNICGAGLLALILVGCTVGPNYKSVKTKVPENFANSKSPAHPGEFAKWWTTLQDPTLDSLVERAVHSNPDLRFAEARLREARAQRGVVKADLLPTVNVSGSYQRSRASKNIGTQQGSSQSTNAVEGDLYQAGFDASWEIDVFGGIRREIEAADADLAAEIENRRNVLVTLLAEVARNYVELRTSQRQVTIAQANLKAQQETLELTRVRFNAGLVSDLDVARAEAQVQTTASQIPVLEISARQSIHLLSVLLGQEPNALIQELTPETAIPASPSDVPVGLPSELLRRRPDIRRAERQVAASTARIGVATADLFPKFSLTGALGFGSSKFSSLGSSGSRFWSIIPGVSLPIFNFGRIRSNIAVQNAREEQAFVIYEQTVLTSLREVEDALVAFSEDQNRHQTLSGAVDANRRAVDLANQLYKQGLTDFLSVLQAQRDLFASEDALVQSNRNVTSDYVAIYKALGGGWEIESAVQPVPVKGKSGERTLDVTSRQGVQASSLHK